MAIVAHVRPHLSGDVLSDSDVYIELLNRF